MNVRELAMKWADENIGDPNREYIIAAFEAGWDGGVNQFQIFGTDGCDRCETGRTTMYRTTKFCVQCQHELDSSAESSKASE